VAARRRAKRRPPQRQQRQLVGSRRPAEAEVDPAGMQRRERAELLGDHEWRVVREHDPARAHPDRRCARGDVRDHDGGRSAGDAGRVVVLSEPEAVVSPALGVLGQVERVPQRIGRRCARNDWREVKDRDREHRPTIPSGIAAAAQHQSHSATSCAR